MNKHTGHIWAVVTGPSVILVRLRILGEKLEQKIQTSIAKLQKAKHTSDQLAINLVRINQPSAARV